MVQIDKADHGENYNRESSIKTRLADPRLARFASELSALLQPALCLTTTRCAQEELPLGSTRIGGRPDLPQHVAWPVWNGKPQSFLAQINLADLAGYPTASSLPEQGWLIFFYDAEQSTWGFDPKDRGSWTVLHLREDQSGLLRRDLPTELPEHAVFLPCRVELSEIVTAAPVELLALDSRGINADERDAYCDILDAEQTENDVRHQLLGHPWPIQGDMQLECQLASHGFYLGSIWPNLGDSKVRDLASDAGNWQLLLQIDSDQNAEMCWGDAGRLYFWIYQEDMRVQNFQNVWMVLQCF